MKKLIALEEFAQFIFVVWIIYQLPTSFNTLSLFLLFFAPDLFAVGYLINRKIGAILYNFSHHKLIALALISMGFIENSNPVIVIGLLVYAHSSFDRVIGYGLKYLESPNLTHLGYIGKEKYKNTIDHF